MLRTSRGRGQPAAAAGPTGPRARRMTRAELEREIRGMCEARGLFCFPSPDGSGFPDLVIAGLGGAVFVTLRAPGRRRDWRAQQTWLDTLQAAGAEVRVWRPAQLITGDIRRVLDRIRLAGPPVKDAL